MADDRSSRYGGRPGPEIARAPSGGFGGPVERDHWGDRGRDAVGDDRLSDLGHRVSSQGRGSEWREPGLGRSRESEYESWRQEQVLQLDADYRAWREHRYRRFSDEFDRWRRARSREIPSRPEGDMSVSSSGSPLADVTTPGIGRSRQGPAGPRGGPPTDADEAKTSSATPPRI